MQSTVRRRGGAGVTFGKQLAEPNGVVVLLHGVVGHDTLDHQGQVVLKLAARASPGCFRGIPETAPSVSGQAHGGTPRAWSGAALGPERRR